MHLSYTFFILLFSIVFENGLCQLYEGSTCTIPSSRTSGTCKLISACPSAVLALQTQGIFPTNCGFQNNLPIVCCVDGSTSGVNSGIPPKITTTTTSRPITRPNPVTRTTTTQQVFLQVGDKSKQKCVEYGKYVLEDAGIVGIVGSGPLPQIEDCPVIEVENIVGGTPAKLKEFPHMALVGFEDDLNTIHWDCGGSLISEKFVLSAAHCTYHRQYSAAKYILLGELVLDSTKDEARPQRISIKNSIRHPSYKPPSNYHDIALFELERKADLSTYVRPACLNTNPSLTNELGVASGWGRVSTFGDVSKALQKVTLEMFTNRECNHTYRKNVGVTLENGIVDATQLCAGSRNDSKDTCQGDSGGPLQIINSKEVFCTYKIIGITSFGKACGLENFPGVYTRVSAYIKWIEDTVWP